MSAHPRKKVTISILIPFLVFILFFSVMVWQKYRSSYEVPTIPSGQSTEGSRTVTLFFTAEGTWLAREARELGPCDNDAACLKSILDELLNGPVGEFEESLPEGTVVDAVHIEGNQATIEFNSTFSDAMLSGSSAEMLAVYSVVNTVAVNFPQIQKVKLNVAGNAAVILSHLDLSDPLPPDYSLEQSSLTKPEKSSTGSNPNHKGVPR